MLLDWVQRRLEELSSFQEIRNWGGTIPAAEQYKRSQRWVVSAALEIGNRFTLAALSLGDFSFLMGKPSDILASQFLTIISKVIFTYIYPIL